MDAVSLLEEILSNIHRSEIPLPGNPLQTLNSYIVRGEGQFLIIDTGMNRRECMCEIVSDLQKLGVDLEKTDFFITHLHADHLGLASTLASDGSKVYFNKLEASIVNSERNSHDWKAIYESHGFPEGELEKAFATHPGQLYGPKRHIDFCILGEGDFPPFLCFIT